MARASEELSPYLCNVCEFLGTNYCIPKRWPMGPLQQSLPPWLKPLVSPLPITATRYNPTTTIKLEHSGIRTTATWKTTT